MFGGLGRCGIEIDYFDWLWRRGRDIRNTLDIWLCYSTFVRKDSNWLSSSQCNPQLRLVLLVDVAHLVVVDGSATKFNNFTAWLVTHFRVKNFINILSTTRTVYFFAIHSLSMFRLINFLNSKYCKDCNFFYNN